LAREIATNTGVPANYISKILRDLAHGGILGSTRGVGGGFRLIRPAKQIRLGDIVAPFENVGHRHRCPFGDPACTESKPCSAHAFYKPVQGAYNKFLDKTTLQAVAAATKIKRPTKGKGAKKKR